VNESYRKHLKEEPPKSSSFKISGINRLVYTFASAVVWWRLFPMQQLLIRNALLLVGAFGSLNVIGHRVMKNNISA
jgi:hypothetical protein